MEASDEILDVYGNAAIFARSVPEIKNPQKCRLHADKVSRDVEPKLIDDDVTQST